MDREAFQGIGFQEGFEIFYRCPTCNSHLVMGTLRCVETAGKRTKRKYNFKNFHLFNAADCDEHFTTEFTCVSPRCGQIVLCLGAVVTWESEILEEDAVPVAIRIYRPQYFSPHLKVFEAPNNTPAKVRECINASFNLLFVSSGSALNEVRNSLEFLMDDLGVPRKGIDSKGREVLLSLHRRVKQMPSQYQPYEDQLLAVKGVGNWGSHAIETDRFDVLKAYDILSLVLDELYSGRRDRVNTISQELRTQKREIIPVKGTP